MLGDDNRALQEATRVNARRDLAHEPDDDDYGNQQ
jgi:hypothetical protein